PQSYLCHAAGGARLSCPEMVLPTRWSDHARLGGHSCRHRLLSRGGARLDQEAWRANSEGHLPSREGACGSLSTLLAARVVPTQPLDQRWKGKKWRRRAKTRPQKRGRCTSLSTI